MEVSLRKATVLLDTHTLIWAVTNRSRLSRRASYHLAEASRVLVSGATAWEIATKVRLGRLPEAVPLERDFFGVTKDAGYELLAIDVEPALQAGRFAAAHKDPFDRILAAQALALDIPILSVDAELDSFGVERIW